VRIILFTKLSPGGLAPPDPPTHARAHRFVGALRACGSLASLVRAWLRFTSGEFSSRSSLRGASPRRTPLHTRARTASSARSARVAHSPRSFALGFASRRENSLHEALSGELRPAGPPYTRARAPLRRRAPRVWLTRLARSRLASLHVRKA